MRSLIEKIESKRDEARQIIEEFEGGLIDEAKEHWFEKGLASGKIKVSHADYEIVRGALIWKSGTWMKGVWEGGEWQGGIWRSGTWRSGTWVDGLWQDGTWEKGTWENGIWRDGNWEGGTWKKGEWWTGTWKDGVWKDGKWKGGIWKSGTWIDGFWKKGTWENGEWRYGAWIDGEWGNGVWKDGEWHDGTWSKGFWGDGDWFGGTWRSGAWDDGTWHGGVWKKGKDAKGKPHIDGDSPDKWSGVSESREMDEAVGSYKNAVALLRRKAKFHEGDEEKTAVSVAKTLLSEPDARSWFGFSPLGKPYRAEINRVTELLSYVIEKWLVSIDSEDAVDRDEVTKIAVDMLIPTWTKQSNNMVGESRPGPHWNPWPTEQTTAKDLAQGLEQSAKTISKDLKGYGFTQQQVDVTASVAWAIKHGDKAKVRKLVDRYGDKIIGGINEVMQWLNGMIR